MVFLPKLFKTWTWQTVMTWSNIWLFSGCSLKLESNNIKRIAFHLIFGIFYYDSLRITKTGACGIETCSITLKDEYSAGIIVRPLLIRHLIAIHFLSRHIQASRLRNFWDCVRKTTTNTFKILVLIYLSFRFLQSILVMNWNK